MKSRLLTNVCLISVQLCLLLAAVSGCHDGTSESNAPFQPPRETKMKIEHPLLGDWIRVDDSCAGAIVRFEHVHGDLVGTLVYPGDELAEYGFEIGVAKMRDVKAQRSGSYLCRSRSQWSPEEVSYNDGEIDAESQQFLLRFSDGSASQRWVRIHADSSAKSHLLLGLFVIHMNRDEGKLARHYASQLVELRSSLRSNELNEIAWELAVASNPRDRMPREALLFAQEACRKGAEPENIFELAFSRYTQANYLDTLAAAAAANGDWDQAISVQRRVCEEGFPDEEMWARLVLYQQNRVYHRGVDLNGIDVSAVKKVLSKDP